MIDDTISSDEDGNLVKIVNLFFSEKKVEEYPEEDEEKYFKKKNPYGFPSPDYLFLMSKIEKISDKRA